MKPTTEPVPSDRPRRRAVLVLLVSLCAACTPDTERPVPEAVMVDLLVDLHLADARLELTGSEQPGLRDSILASYDVDAATYARAIAFYSEHPREYGELYSRVLDRLNVERLPLSGSPDVSLDDFGQDAFPGISAPSR